MKNAREEEKSRRRRTAATHTRMNESWVQSILECRSSRSHCLFFGCLARIYYIAIDTQLRGRTTFRHIQASVGAQFLIETHVHYYECGTNLIRDNVFYDCFRVGFWFIDVRVSKRRNRSPRTRWKVRDACRMENEIFEPKWPEPLMNNVLMR